MFLCKYEDQSTIIWYCKKCAITCKQLMTMMLSVQDTLQQLEDSVYGVASTLNTKMDDLSASLSARLDIKDQHEAVAIQEVQKTLRQRWILSQIL